MELDANDVRSLNKTTQMRGYFEDGSEGFLYVKEFETHRLVSEFSFLLRLMNEVTSELLFRESSNKNYVEIMEEHTELAEEIDDVLTEYKVYE